MSLREYTFFDRILMSLDQGIRSVWGPIVQEDTRASPAAKIPESSLDATQRQQVIGLMRVNHAGEVCAQALYQGQALTARAHPVRNKLEQAAKEENDHLIWCEQRITELGGHASYLGPIWYSGSWLIGVGAGLMGDRWSLGFLAETEKQVAQHLEGHLQQLPEPDRKSRAIVNQMHEDEIGHASVALAAGASGLPTVVRYSMYTASKIMTTLAYWV